MTQEQYDHIHSLDLHQLGKFYRSVWEQNDKEVIRDLILNDRFFLLTQVLDVDVAWHPWVLERCREVEAEPDERPAPAPKDIPTEKKVEVANDGRDALRRVRSQ